MDFMEDAAPERREDRGPRIPPAKLTTLEDTSPYISIFYKQARNSALQCVDAKFSRDVAMIFCDRIRHELMDNNSKAFTVTGIDLKGLKYVLDWIKASVQEKKLVDFEKFDQEDPDIFLKYLNTIIAANYLGIPARDFAEGMTKVMLGVARKVRMSWDHVDYFLYDPALDTCSEQVRDIATASIFYAWWTCKLTDEDTPDDMMYLSWLRDQDKKLDTDLHDWCVRNQLEVEKKRAEKRAKRAQEAASGGDGTGAGEGWGNEGATSGFSGDAGGGSGWDTGNPDATPVVSGGWDNPIDGQSTQADTGWENVAPAGLQTISISTSDNVFNSHGPTITTQSADKAWDSGVDVATRENTPGAYDSASTFTTEEITGGAGNASGVGRGVLPAFDSDTAAGGDWADEVNQHDQYVKQQW